MRYFYPRSPRGERRFKRDFANITTIFLSTLPARGATARIWNEWFRDEFLSTLPARGATRRCRSRQASAPPISIHAPREGSDDAGQGLGVVGVVISIHAPREGSDRGSPGSFCWIQISIHAPREGSDSRRWRTWTWSCLFLSTLPARGATL